MGLGGGDRGSEETTKENGITRLLGIGAKIESGGLFYLIGQRVWTEYPVLLRGANSIRLRFVRCCVSIVNPSPQAKNDGHINTFRCLELIFFLNEQFE